MLTGPRLRQVALVARDCGRVAGELRRAFGWPRPFRDPGVGEFGLTNAVFAVGDTFIEVVAPARPDTTENLNRAVTGELGDCMDLEVTHHLHTGLTEDHREAARAFVDKREPRFRGR